LRASVTRPACGQVDSELWPGDASPFGDLITTATMGRFNGTTTNTIDLTANRTAAFTWSGRIIDLCAPLS
jgi:hypothetical protein